MYRIGSASSPQSEQARITRAERLHRERVFGRDRLEAAQRDIPEVQTLNVFSWLVRSMCESPLANKGCFYGPTRHVRRPDGGMMTLGMADPTGRRPVGSQVEMADVYLRDVIAEKPRWQRRGLSIGRFAVNETVFIAVDGRPKVERQLTPRPWLPGVHSQIAIAPASETDVQRAIDALTTAVIDEPGRNSLWAAMAASQE